MSDQRDFLTTIKQLMRFTREGKIEWQERDPAHKNALPSFEGQYNDMVFRLEDAVSPHTATDYVRGLSDLKSMFDIKYRLIIEDRSAPSDEPPVVSPPMKAATDLVFVIRGMPGKEKLDDINRRLAG